MSHHVKSDLPAYFNGDLSDAKRQQVETHLGECAACRHAANKIRARLSRGKRQALKSALPDRVPNLLLARLGRQMHRAPRPSPTPWAGILGVLLLIAIGAWLFLRPQHGRGWKNSFLHMSGPAVDFSTATAPGAAFQVDHSSPAALQVNTADNGAGATAVAASTAAVAHASEAIAPQWAGDDSDIKEARDVVVRTRRAWRALWAEMGRTDRAPTVDFNDFVVIGIFAGERPPGHYQLSFGAPLDQEDVVIIPYKIAGPLAGASAPTTPAHPYLLATVQRFPKPIRLRLETP